ncbi:MAG: SRPBCC family protein [Patiriisocius sp.]|uniref:SRPBCC family protein n=1 Tax=Patiriisocius sp. TaxID=2822396 RepID=UPI003EF1080B
MTTIKLVTEINAPINLVFDLSRDIDFHMESASHTKEKAIRGVTHGLIGHDETVTWRGKHFGIFLQHTSKIITFERPHKFTDVMIKGHFKYFCHEHFFEEREGITIMTDVLKYKTPFGLFGNLFDSFLLKSHLTKFLKQRNRSLKISAEKNALCK